MKQNVFVKCAVVAALLSCVSCFDSSRPRHTGYMAGIGRNPNETPSNGDHHSPPAIHDDFSYWEGDGVSGAPMIKINRAKQTASFYKGGALVGVSKISSGNEDHGTPPGTYKITEKDQNHKSSAYGVFKDRATGQTTNDNVDIRTDKPKPNEIFYAAPMPNFMRFSGGIGMHTGYLPGYAASHGCIRMPHQMSTKFFENVQLGTPVVVE